MKPYYDIAHKPFSEPFWESFFQDGVAHVSENTEYKMHLYTCMRKSNEYVSIYWVV